MKVVVMPKHNEKSRGGVKLSDTEREEVIERVAHYDRFGFSQREIAMKVWEEMRLHISQVMVGKYLKKIRQRYKEAIIGSRAEQVQVLLERLRTVRKEALLAYQESKKPLKKKSHEEGSNGKAYVDKKTVTIEQRLPGIEYLKVVMECDRQERALLGIDEPPIQINKNLNVNGSLPQEVWDELLAPPKRGEAEKLVERVLEEQRQQLQLDHKKGVGKNGKAQRNGTTKGGHSDSHG